MAEAVFETPLGPLYASATANGLQRLEFVRGDRTDQLIAGVFEGGDEEAQQLLAETERQLTEYFAGDRREFDLPLEPIGSDFQLRVWQVIASIPYGDVMSYADVALAAGNPGAFRAAGTACGNNKLAVVIPCHRVVASGRRIGGYGGGLGNKLTLLELEGSLGTIKGYQRPLEAAAAKAR